MTDCLFVGISDNKGQNSPGDPPMNPVLGKQRFAHVWSPLQLWERLLRILVLTRVIALFHSPRRVDSSWPWRSRARLPVLRRRPSGQRLSCCLASLAQLLLLTCLQLENCKFVRFPKDNVAPHSAVGLFYHNMWQMAGQSPRSLALYRPPRTPPCLRAVTNEVRQAEFDEDSRRYWVEIGNARTCLPFNLACCLILGSDAFSRLCTPPGWRLERVRE